MRISDWSSDVCFPIFDKRILREFDEACLAPATRSSPMRSKPYGRYRTSPSRCSPATNVSKNLVSDLERGKKKRGGLRRGVRTSCETKLIRRHLAGWPTRMLDRKSTRLNSSH